MKMKGSVSAGQQPITRFFASPKQALESSCCQHECVDVSGSPTSAKNNEVPAAKISLEEWESTWDSETKGRSWKKVKIDADVTAADGSGVSHSPVQEGNLAEEDFVGKSKVQCHSNFAQKQSNSVKLFDKPSSEDICEPTMHKIAHELKFEAVQTNLRDKPISTGPTDKIRSHSQAFPKNCRAGTDRQGEIAGAAVSDAYVLLPCQSRRGWQEIAERWLNIGCIFEELPQDFDELRRAILAYEDSGRNGRRPRQFKVLDIVLNEIFSAVERARFFDQTLPTIVCLALKLPKLFAYRIPLLVQGKNGEVRLTQLQLCSLLANMFLCTFRRRNTTSGDFGHVNFYDLFDPSPYPKDREQDRIAMNSQKLLCILHYFDCMTTRFRNKDDLSSPVSFIRRVLDTDPRWHDSEAPISCIDLRVRIKGSIEDFDVESFDQGDVDGAHGSAGSCNSADDPYSGSGCRSGGRVPEPQASLCPYWQADFANSMIGGGVLGNGCVQEEIRFAISPELIVSRLLAERLGSDETLVIVGTERFCRYRGYSKTFAFAGAFSDHSPFDTAGRRMSVVTAFDAVQFKADRALGQFEPPLVRRELDKALCAFLPLPLPAGRDARRCEDISSASGADGHTALAGNESDLDIESKCGLSGEHVLCLADEGPCGESGRRRPTDSEEGVAGGGAGGTNGVAGMGEEQYEGDTDIEASSDRERSDEERRIRGNMAVQAVRKETGATIAVDGEEEMEAAAAAAAAAERAAVEVVNRGRIVTGNWGCGAFGGELTLKAVVQIMAAAHAG